MDMNKKIDFYVEVIDNFWDLWFAINLASIMLKNDNYLDIRIFSNDEALFKNMIKNNTLLTKITYYDLSQIINFEPNNLIFNFFDRKINFNYLNSFNFNIKLINFWYFLMHKWVETLHMTNYFNDNVEVTHFIPSLLKNTWWILINKIDNYYKEEFLSYLEKKYDIKFDLQNYENIVSIFVYKDTLEEILPYLDIANTKYFIFWYPDKKINNKNIKIMPFFEFEDYNNFMWICDINFVRGENSLISSLIYNKPTLWDIYKEENNAHIDKIDDFLYFLKWFSNFNIDYIELMNGFNSKSKNICFNNFIFDNKKYSKMFEELWNYVNNECNAYEKIKKILN